RRDKRAIAVTTDVRLEGRQPAVLIEEFAFRTRVPTGKPHHWDVSAVCRGRHDEAADHQLALQPRLVQIRVADAPSVDAGDHERFVSECDNRPDTVCRYE